MGNIHDGIGERLINVNTSVLNDPAFRAAGWFPSAADIRRAYSPPIPAAVTSEYFRTPHASANNHGTAQAEEEDEGGMVTGGGSHDTAGPALLPRRRRRKEQHEEDDSSDLSDESDDELDTAQRPVNQIRFAKMPLRKLSESSPNKSPLQDDKTNDFISPSRPPDVECTRRDSQGASELLRTRGRRDTTTSSELSSDNDMDPNLFRRKQMQPRPSSKPSRVLLGQLTEEDAASDVVAGSTTTGGIDVDSDEDSLASGLSAIADPTSLLGGMTNVMQPSPTGLRAIPQSFGAKAPSPARSGRPFVELIALPPPRPISMVQPVSMLSLALKARFAKPTSPFERFGILSGAGSPDPLYIKVFLPASIQPRKPLEIVVRRTTDDGIKVTVSEVIGFGLWRYAEEEIQPPFTAAKTNVNWWTLRMMEDGEVDFDFPALTRTRPMIDFTSNNNRPPRGRSRDKPWDEMALVEATSSQFRDNEAATPVYSEQAASAAKTNIADDGAPPPGRQVESAHNNPGPRENPITESRFTRANRQNSMNALDAPTEPIAHFTQRTGAPKILNVHFMDNDYRPRAVGIEVTTDTYFAEVFDRICKKLNVDKAQYVLKVTRTTTVVPFDRTVEALGTDRASLDLIRRRFVGDGTFGFPGSPGSSSPNAPLLVNNVESPKKARRPGALHPLAQQTDFAGLGLAVGTNANYKRYNVIRKQPMSFSPSHPRILVLDGEYLHVMPGDTAKEKLFDTQQGKLTTIHFSGVVGCKVSRKHPKTFRVVIFRERETKRYDFEASSAGEAAEIVQEIKKNVAPYRDDLGQ